MVVVESSVAIQSVLVERLDYISLAKLMLKLLP